MVYDLERKANAENAPSNRISQFSATTSDERKKITKSLPVYDICSWDGGNMVTKNLYKFPLSQGYGIIKL